MDGLTFRLDERGQSICSRRRETLNKTESSTTLNSVYFGGLLRLSGWSSRSGELDLVLLDEDLYKGPKVESNLRKVVRRKFETSIFLLKYSLAGKNLLRETSSVMNIISDSKETVKGESEMVKSRVTRSQIDGRRRRKTTSCKRLVVPGETNGYPV